ncbi:MAG: sugar phosphate isomerase/epimerase [Clostridia bacterium]|nr:sugar phosphate isomerase/epimerase [Clostridia bacterium]
MKIGAQLYTTCEFCQTLDGFAETLRKVADIGYTTVQVSGTCPFEADWLKNQLDATGLSCVLTHTPPPQLTGDIQKVIDNHNVFGCDYVGLGFWAFDPERDMSYEKFIETYVPVAKALKEGGKYFMYHNHDGEFRRLGDKIVLEHLLEEVPAEIMGFTVDTFWVQAGGGDPAQWLEKLTGRIPCIHLKDYAFGRQMAVVGEGNINFDRVFEKAEAGGTQYMLVEQDDCHGEDPFACLKRSYDYLRSRGFD